MARKKFVTKTKIKIFTKQNIGQKYLVVFLRAMTKSFFRMRIGALAI